MDLSKIIKFKKFVQNKKIIYFDDKLNITTFSKIKYPYKLLNDEILIYVSDKIYIVYNKRIKLVQCIFSSEPEYVQTEIFINNFSRNSGYIKYFSNFIDSRFNINLSNCLILGLCLGNMPNHLIQKYNHKISRIDCVDISNLLCLLYKNFFCISYKIHVYSLAAEEFIEKTKIKYNYIMIDIPCQFITIKFMQYIYNISILNTIIHVNLIGDDCDKINITTLFTNFTILKFNKIHENNLYILYKNKN